MPVNIAERLAFYEKWQKQSIVLGRSARLIGSESGMSMSYQFGPKQYLVWMTDEDWAHLQSNRWERWQFIEVSPDWSAEAMVRPPMSKEQWMMLLDDFALLGPGRVAGGRLSAKQIAKDAKRRQELQYSAERVEEFAEEAQRQNAPQVRIVRR